MKEPAFWDASALVPLCIYEMRTSAAASYMRKLSPVVWWGTPIEVQSAIYRLHREKAITDATREAGVARLGVLNAGWREVPAGDKLRDLASDLLRRYPLKASDSLQLSASLLWCDERPARRSIVCADQRLSRTARSIGFAVLELFSASSST
jgi:predicted nucleic acid-binding protein